MIRLQFLSRTNLSEDYLHSVLISLLRGLAALEVAAAHLRAQVYPGYATVAHPGAAFQALAFFTGFAHQAVVVFFLLSGWLVGGSLLNKRTQQDAMKHYAIDRMTRLWIVLIPTFVLILALAALSAQINPLALSVAASNEFSATAFFGNLVGLQNIFVAPFGGNFPLWSLSNETWYYALFPLLVAGAGTGPKKTRILAVLAFAGLAWLLPGPLLLYFMIWLIGVAGSRVKVCGSAAVRWLLLFGFLGAAVYFRMRGKNDDMGIDSFPQDLLFSILFILWLTSTQVRLTRVGVVLASLKRSAKFFADFSFTLYVIHVPLIKFSSLLLPYLARSKLVPNNPAHLLVYGTILVVIIAVAYLFYLPFEANTQRARMLLKGAALPARSSA